MRHICPAAEQEPRRQGDMVSALSVQISEIMSDRKKEDAVRIDLRDQCDAQTDVESICRMISKIDADLKDMKDQHANCKNIGKTIDELGALHGVSEVEIAARL